MLRIFAVGCSVTCFTIALSLAPLVQVTALSFTAPFFVLMLARICYRERIDFARWAAAGVGLAGVLFVIYPAAGLAETPGQFNGVLLALVGSFCLATAWTSVRRLHSMSQSLAVLVVPPIVMTVAVSGTLALPSLQLPPVETLPVLAVAAVVTFLSHLLQCLSFRHGRPTRVAPVDFTEGAADLLTVLDHL